MGRSTAGFGGAHVTGARVSFRILVWIIARIFVGRIVFAQKFGARLFVAGIVGASRFLLALVDSEGS